MPDPSTYWVNLGEDELGRRLLERVDTYNTAGLTQGVHDKHARAFQYYFGFDPAGVHATSQVLREGEQGELAAIRVNHSRPLVNTLLNLIVAPKLVWQPKATNIDYESLRECDLASAVLEFYWKEKHVSRHAIRALEEALVFCEGFVFVEWREDSGEPSLVSLPEDNAPGIPSEASLLDKVKPLSPGDLHFHNVSAWDVIRDPNKHSWDELDWVIVRRWVNRFDLIALHPDKATEIQHAPGEVRENAGRNTMARESDKETDDIPVYYFFHKKTPAVPNGRQALVLQNGVVLSAGDLKYREIPLYRVSAGEMFGTPFGYSPYLDVLGIQELMDSLHTSIASNQSTLATQLVAIPHGEDTTIDEIAGGMKVIYFDPSLGPQAVPQGINLTKTPSEVFSYVKELKTHQELIFGLNSVVRGEAQSGEMSGSALALLQSQALQQSSVIQSNWLRMVESLGTCVIDMIRDFATVPHKIALAGKSSTALLPEQDIGKDSFKRIRRVHVEIGNPMSQTSAGRAEMAKDMMNLRLISTPEQYQEVLSSGQLRMLTEGLHHELLLIRGENEQLASGEAPPVADLDNHELHVREHKAVLANPQVRKDPKLMRAVLTHVTEHQVAFYTTDPTLLLLAGIQPPMPMGGPPMGPEAGPGGPPPEAGPGAEDVTKPPGNPNAGRKPKMPNEPTNPATGLEWDPVSGGGIKPNPQ